MFRLGDDEFGLPIEAVDEVARVPDQITRLPKTPKFLEGVINLRGEVLPVVDQRRRFDMPALEPTRGARRLIVVRTERHRAGLIVDSVSEVLRCAADAIEPAPEPHRRSRCAWSSGVINLEKAGRIVLLLDPAELLTPRRARPARRVRSQDGAGAFVIKVLVVDDSALVRKLLGQIFARRGRLRGRSSRATGWKRWTARQAFQPDVITLDIHMPQMDGLACLDRIMVERPCPVVMVSSLTAEGADATLEALRLGAVDFVAKPTGAVSLHIDELRAELVAKVRAAAGASSSRARG